MPDTYHICSLYVFGETPGTRQCFEFRTDSDPMPPREICITGNNGTGKSSLLKDIREHFAPAGSAANLETRSTEPTKLIVSELLIDDKTLFRVTGHAPSRQKIVRTFTDTPPLREALQQLHSGQTALADTVEFFFQHETLETADSRKLRTALLFPADCNGDQNDCKADLPRALNRNFSDRRDQFLLFLAEGSTQEKTVSEAIAEFRENCPNPLERLANLWNETLESSAGIKFHSNTATFSFPGDSGAADFNLLSPALKSFLSRTGSLFLSLNSGATPPAVILIDEPEWGLAPELSARFIEIVRCMISGNDIQIILTTKCPDIATSIPKAGHIHLKLDPDGTRTGAIPFEEEDADEVEAGIENETENEDEVESEVEVESETTPEENPESSAGSEGSETPPKKVNLAKLKRAIEATDDQDELANLIDELMSLRKL